MWIKLPMIVLITIASVPAYAGGAANTEQHNRSQDDYYASDLYEAITEAKVRTHHYDYSNEHRYNRTTSQSIQFSRMLNNELDNQMIENPSLGGASENTQEDGNVKVAAVKTLQDNEKLTAGTGTVIAPKTTINITPITNSNISINISPR